MDRDVTQLDFGHARTLHREVSRGRLLLREDPPTSIGTAISGALTGLAFVAFGVFAGLADMAPENGGGWPQYLFATGFVMIGSLVWWSTFSAKTSFAQIEMDVDSKVLRVGKWFEDERLNVDTTLPFSKIDRFVAGSNSAGRVHNPAALTALYVIGQDVPGNGGLLTGSVFELEQAARDLNRMLDGAMPEQESEFG